MESRQYSLRKSRKERSRQRMKKGASSDEESTTLSDIYDIENKTTKKITQKGKGRKELLKWWRAGNSSGQESFLER